LIFIHKDLYGRVYKAYLMELTIGFEDVNAEIARRALGKAKWTTKATIPTASEATFGCAGGLHGKKGDKYYCPTFVIPSDHTAILCSDLHNCSDAAGDIGVKVTDAITGTTLLEPTYQAIGGFQHLRFQLRITDIKNPLLLDIHIGTKLDSTFTEQSRFRVAIQVSGKPAVAEYSTNELDIVYPNTDTITAYPSKKPYVIATTLWLYVVGATEEGYDIRLLPVIRLQGEPIRGSKLIFWAMNAGYKKPAIDLRASAFAINEAYYELASIAEDMDIGYSVGTIIRNRVEASVPPDLEEEFAISFAFALGNQPTWWEPWDWRADEALMLAWGRPPDYDLDTVRAGVVNFKPIGEEELNAYAAKFIEECTHRGAVGSYPAGIYYSQKGWGGVLDADVISPSYSPIAPLVALAVIFASVAAAIIAIGFVILKIAEIKHKELLMSQSKFDSTKFTTERDAIAYDQANYSDEMKEAGMWGEHTPECKYKFYDPITGEEAPSNIDTPVEYYDWMKARHPDWAKDVYGEEEEVSITPVVAYTAAAIGIYVAGGLLPANLEKVKYTAAIPGILAGYETYKFISKKIPFFF
jgi:hypothetical protein